MKKKICRKMQNIYNIAIVSVFYSLLRDIQLDVLKISLLVSLFATLALTFRVFATRHCRGTKLRCICHVISMLCFVCGLSRVKVAIKLRGDQVAVAYNRNLG